MRTLADGEMSFRLPSLSINLLLVWCLLCDIPCFASGLASELSRLTGYVVLADETIEEFEGCEYGMKVRFQSGSYVTCNSYGFQYTYGADAVILVRPVDENTFHCKMIVEDEVYEVSCERYIHDKVNYLRRYRDQSTDKNARKFVDYWLRILGVEG